MQSPFPGMNPYLEQPAFWSSFHSRLMVAIAPLQAVFDQVFREGRYGARIDYQLRMPPPSLSEEALVWVEKLLRGEQAVAKVQDERLK